MVAHCALTCVLYQCATVAPDAFSSGVPFESGPNETKINADATRPINHINRFKLESFIGSPFTLSFSVERDQVPSPGATRPPQSQFCTLQPKKRGTVVPVSLAWG